MPVPADRSRRRDRRDRLRLVRVKTRTSRSPRRKAARSTSTRPTIWARARNRASPAFLQAYYGAGLGDWCVVWERRAQPGDTILLHAGLYKPERFNYVDPMMTPFDGSMSLTLKGTREKPITIKAAGDGEVIFDGDGNHALVRRDGVAAITSSTASPSATPTSPSSPARKRSSARSG